MLVNKENQLIGSITDGDIRRAIIKGYSLDDKVEKFVIKPFKRNEKMNLQQIKYMMIKQSYYLQLIKKIIMYILFKNPFGRLLVYIFYNGRKRKKVDAAYKKIPKPLLKIMANLLSSTQLMLKIKDSKICTFRTI